MEPARVARRNSHAYGTIYFADTLLIDEISTQSPSHPSVYRPLYIDPFTNEPGQIVHTRRSIFARAERTHLGCERRDERSEYAIVQREDNARELRQRLARVTNSLRGLPLSEVTGHKVMTCCHPPGISYAAPSHAFCIIPLSLSLRASFPYAHSFLSMFPCHCFCAQFHLQLCLSRNCPDILCFLPFHRRCFVCHACREHCYIVDINLFLTTSVIVIPFLRGTRMCQFYNCGCY